MFFSNNVPCIQTIIVASLGYILTIFLGHVIVHCILKLCSKPDHVNDLKRAGTIIGILERIFVITFVLLNQYSAIAFIFAAKSIVRFGESKDRKFAEYYLIGTMSSILISMIIGIITTFIVKLVQ